MKKEAGEGTINNDTVSILSLHSQIIQKGKIYEKKNWLNEECLEKQSEHKNKNRRNKKNDKSICKILYNNMLW